MKKSIFLISVFCAALISVGGCGGVKPAADEEVSDSSDTPVSETETEPPTELPTDNNSSDMVVTTEASKSDNEGNTAPSSTQPTEAPTESPTVQEQYDFEEIVLFESPSAAVRITGIDEDNLWGYSLKAYLENNSDRNLMYSMEDVAVNGIMCDPFWAKSVSANAKANDSISFSDSTLKKNGITEITEITGTLRINDNDDWLADDVANTPFVIYPKGENAAASQIRDSDYDGIVLVDNEQCKIVVTSFEPDSFWGYSLNVHLENKTDRNLMFACDSATINGFMCDPFWADSVSAGKTANDEITWSDSVFEENGITEVDEIKISISVYDSDDWMAEHILDDTFVLNP